MEDLLLRNWMTKITSVSLVTESEELIHWQLAAATMSANYTSNDSTPERRVRYDSRIVDATCQIFKTRRRC
jgi:hypothetical protein